MPEGDKHGLRRRSQRSGSSGYHHWSGGTWKFRSDLDRHWSHPDDSDRSRGLPICFEAQLVTGAPKLRAGRWGVTAFVVAVLAAVTVVVHRQTDDFVMIGYWYAGSLVIIGCLVAFVVGRRFTDNEVAGGKVLCIVPAYNEDPDGLKKTVLALLGQTVAVDIVVIDDGSQIPVEPSITHPRVTWKRQDNTGKRGAQVAVLRGFDRDKYEFI